MCYLFFFDPLLQLLRYLFFEKRQSLLQFMSNQLLRRKLELYMRAMSGGMRDLRFDLSMPHLFFDLFFKRL